MKIFKQAIGNLEKKHPFVIFSLPESYALTGFFQNDNKPSRCSDFTKNGFVFAPFDFEKDSYFIEKEKALVIEEEIVINDILKKEKDIDFDTKEKEAYLELLQKTVDTIESSELKKIVTSRKITIPLLDLDFVTLFNRLFNLYPNSFRYVWFHPETGLWCGATPEILVQTKDLSFTTMALAGTKKIINGEALIWTTKEKEEQQYVTDAIINALEPVTSMIRISKRHTKHAGEIAHLCTDVTGVFNYHKTNLASITQALHPTPAVCGTPRDEAKEYILKNEGYNREFYTGFLGPVCKESKCSYFFVNLRCLKIQDMLATLYVGGGITKDSIPQLEWEETQNKLQTMMQVIAPFT